MAPFILAFKVICWLGMLLGLGLCSHGALRGLVRAPRTITPQDYQAERLAAHPVKPGGFPPDMAWPFYPFRQLRTDLRLIGASCYQGYGAVWVWPRDVFADGVDSHPFVWVVLLSPITLSALTFLLVAGLTMTAIYLLFALIAVGFTLVTGALFWPAAALLRGAERGWRTVMRAEASCPTPPCYHVSPRPAYRCPRCARLHRDIRPGRLGLLTRRCVCGRLLPTMVLRAAWRLDAVCQRCGNPVRPGSAAVRDLRIPVFGDMSAGKTRWLYSALDSLMETTRKAGLEFGFPDPASEEAAEVALALIRAGRDTLKTSVNLPAALSCRLGTGRGCTLVHLFDAAGENFQDSQLHDSLGFLGAAQGLVYVLDPFSIGAIRDQLTGHNAATIRHAHAAAGDPENAYSGVVSRLRDSGVKASAQRLAVVISKADILQAAGLRLPSGSRAIADWLAQRGVHNLVLSAPREFAEVNYFMVASQAGGESCPHDPGKPLRWLLRTHGARLPAEPPAGAVKAAP